MTTKKVTSQGADILYLRFKPTEEIAQLDLIDWVLFDRNESKEIIREIWIKLPYKGSLPITYQDSLHFDTLKQLVEKARESRVNKNYDSKWITACLFEKGGKVVASGVQDINLHVFENPMDSVCYRERLKERGLLTTGGGYDTCPGCNQKNHGEPNAIRNAQNPEDLEHSTAYLYGHWWYCQTCTELMTQLGVTDLIICKSWVKQFFGIE